MTPMTERRAWWWLAGLVALAASLPACNQRAAALGPDRAAERAPGTGSNYQQGTLVLNRAGVDPGIHPAVIWGERRNPFANDPASAVEGRALFVGYNCSGCHGGRAGGGMGPSLRDEYWIYGNSDTQLLSTIAEGRSAGMPAWGARIPEQQIWKLITYIRTLGTPQEPDPPPPEANVPMYPSPDGATSAGQIGTTQAGARPTQPAGNNPGAGH